MKKLARLKCGILKSIYRNFVRKPSTNLINLVGLAVSLALVIILSVYSYSELTTDNFHKNGERVYLYADLNDGMYMPAILKDQIDLTIPEVETAVRLSETWDVPVFQAEGRDPITSDLVFADDGFFKLFTYQEVEGNLATALKDPMTVVITKSLAGRLFGNEPALGKTFRFNNDKELTVSAVVEEPKVNTCLSFSALTSNATRKIVMPNEGEFTDWNYGNFQMFVLLKKGADVEKTTKSILALFPKSDKSFYTVSKLNPLRKIYFSNFNLYGSNYLQHGDKGKVMILLLVAVLVLMISLVNFINISSSQWMEKIKQTGVLKVIGAKNSAIMGNVLLEAALFFLLALAIAIILISIVNPFIQNYTGIHFNHQLTIAPGFFIVMIVGALILSLVFSIIPAIRIASSNAVDNLKRKVETQKWGFSFSGFLVTTQFVVAIVLIAFTVLVQKQVNFGSSNLGFNQNNIIGIKLTQQLDKKKEVLKKLLQEKPSVEDISFGQYYPGEINSHWKTKLELNGSKQPIEFDTFTADADFFKLMGLKLRMGQFYDPSLPSDKNKVMVNEAFVREYQLGNPIGAKFAMGMDGQGSEIIGVIKDFHYKPVNQPILPLVIRNRRWSSYCLVGLPAGDFNSLHQTIEGIKKATAKLSPSFPVEISFLDQAIEQMYRSELQFRRTFTLFSGCAIVICCLGILAMSLFSCQRRIKEIGIRKVNGARISEVMTMLNRDFVKWVAIAFVIATPIAYYTMNKWLESFAYKTVLSWWIFAMAGLMALGIALLTVSWQSWKAATRNPVEALRYE